MGIIFNRENSWINKSSRNYLSNISTGAFWRNDSARTDLKPISSTIDSIIYFHNHPFPFGAYPLASILATNGFTPSQNP